MTPLGLSFLPIFVTFCLNFAVFFVFGPSRSQLLLSLLTCFRLLARALELRLLSTCCAEGRDSNQLAMAGTFGPQKPRFGRFLKETWLKFIMSRYI